MDSKTAENLKEEYMLRAVRLAEKGTGWTSPNPLVGAVIVKDGRIIGEGWHHRYGDLHAERDALKNCTEDPKGADIYVTLEPCCHHGKQPPCTDALIEAGISRVIIGSSDPNPLVAGKGVRILKEHGISVVEDFLKDECDSLNDIFFYYITRGLPYVAMKYAMTADGKIACYTGLSKWVTGEEARKHVHSLRHKYTGIMAGINTVLTDDPMLNCRLENTRDPVRIICDSSLRIPLDSQIVKTAGQYRTIVAACSPDEEKVRRLSDSGVEVIDINKVKTDGAAPDFKQVDIRTLMEELCRRKIDSILLEGGAALNWSVLEAGLVNKVYAYIAPKIFGGENARSPVAGEGFPEPDKAVMLKNAEITRLGDDILLEAECS